MFDTDAIRAIGGEVTQDGDFLNFEMNRYTHKGYLYKSFAISAIVADGVKPTLSELEKFEEQSLADMEVCFFHCTLHIIYIMLNWIAIFYVLISNFFLKGY